MMKILIAFSLLFCNIFLQFVGCSHNSEFSSKIKRKSSYGGGGTTVILGKDSSSSEDGTRNTSRKLKTPSSSKRNKRRKAKKVPSVEEQEIEVSLSALIQSFIKDAKNDENLHISIKKCTELIDATEFTEFFLKEYQNYGQVKDYHANAAKNMLVGLIRKHLAFELGIKKGKRPAKEILILFFQNRYCISL